MTLGLRRMESNDDRTGAIFVKPDTSNIIKQKENCSESNLTCRRWAYWG